MNTKITIIMILSILMFSGCVDDKIILYDNLDVNILDNNTGNVVTVQYPLSGDGDSVYVKDLDLTKSNNNNFSGEVTDYFNSLTSVNYANGSENPKTLTIAFKRSLQVNRIGLGCDDSNSNFSNVVVKALGSGMTVRYTNDVYKNDNNKTNSLLINIIPQALNGFTIEFHTNDTVCLSNIIIFKSTDSNVQIQGARPDGTLGTAEVSNSNRLNTVSQKYTYSIAEGEIPGHKALLKFGTRTTVSAGTSSTIWEGNTHRYVYMSTAQQLKVSSSSVLDTALGTGARTLVIYGLNSTYDEINEIITLNGTSIVTTNNSFIRVYRAFVYTSGTLYTNAGKITIYNNAVTAEQAVINAGDGQTLMSIWTVPRCKTAFIVKGSASTDSNKGARLSLFVRQIDGGILYPWLIKYRGYLFSGAIQIPLEIPYVVPEKTDIEMRVFTPVAAGSTSVGGTFELWYEDTPNCTS